METAGNTVSEIDPADDRRSGSPGMDRIVHPIRPVFTRELVDRAWNETRVELLLAQGVSDALPSPITMVARVPGDICRADGA